MNTLRSLVRLGGRLESGRLARRLLPWLLVALPATLAATDHDGVRRAVQAGLHKPLAEILADLEHRYRAKVLDVELELDALGQPVYEIELLDADQRQHDVLVDPATGRVVAPPRLPPVKPLAPILRSLLAKFPGHVLNVDLESGAGQRQVYEIRLAMEGGSLRDVLVDAHDGRLLDADVNRAATLISLKPVPAVLETVIKRHGGQVREVELERDHQGRPYYEVDLSLQNGRLLEVRVDAVSGAILPSGPY